MPQAVAGWSGRSSRRAALVSKAAEVGVKQLSDWWWPTLPLTKVAAIRRSLDLDPGRWTPAGRPFESVCSRSLARCSLFSLMMLALALALAPVSQSWSLLPYLGRL